MSVSSTTTFISNLTPVMAVMIAILCCVAGIAMIALAMFIRRRCSNKVEIISSKINEESTTATYSNEVERV